MRALIIGASLVLAASSSAATARAQTWSGTRGLPALWHIISIDRTGEPSWPYGAEDIAGDGIGTFATDESGVDVRTLYADATGERLWLRAYVSAASGPATNLAAFFFIDADARDDTGGPADADLLEQTLGDDPTRGGYERAIGVRGDGSVLGAWDWNAPQRAWTPLSLGPITVRAELGRASDPLGLGAVEHGYVQVDLEHSVSGLNASCGGQILVRTRHLAAAPRAFGDDDRTAAACRPRADVYGDPIVLRSFTCRADAECPNDGRCRDGVCLFTYDCSSAADCRDGMRCTANQCVLAAAPSCATQADCNGLVCENGACVACTELGTRACAAGLACSPNGGCVDADAFVPSDGEPGIGRVQGGAFSCAAGSHSSGSSPLGWLLALSIFGLHRRRSTRRNERVHADEEVRCSR